MIFILSDGEFRDFIIINLDGKTWTLVFFLVKTLFDFFEIFHFSINLINRLLVSPKLSHSIIEFDLNVLLKSYKNYRLTKIRSLSFPLSSNLQHWSILIKVNTNLSRIPTKFSGNSFLQKWRMKKPKQES